MIHQITITIDPYSETEHYLKSMITAYQLLGVSVLPLKMKNLKSSKYVMLNWFENIPEKDLIKIIIQFTKKIIKIAIYLLFRKKIIWTLHNKKMHRVKKHTVISAFFSKCLMKILSVVCKKIIIHSRIDETAYKSFSKKFIYVPHPHCIDFYGKPVVQHTLTDNILKLLFFGTILPYKNLDLLIEITKELDFPNLELYIHGNISPEYRIQIEELIDAHDKIKFRFEFIPDADVPRIVSDCHLMVVPFDIESCFNSSTTILAFSYKRSVVSTEIGTVLDMKNKALYFGYTYSNQSEHKQNLKNIIANIYLSFSGRYNDLLRLGEDGFKFFESNNSIEMTSDSLKSVFE